MDLKNKINNILSPKKKLSIHSLKKDVGDG